jgi:hypothetical protein
MTFIRLTLLTAFWAFLLFMSWIELTYHPLGIAPL